MARRSSEGEDEEAGRERGGHMVREWRGLEKLVLPAYAGGTRRGKGEEGESNVLIVQSPCGIKKSKIKWESV